MALHTGEGSLDRGKDIGEDCAVSEALHEGFQSTEDHMSLAK
jgi:hypothetical protein